MEERRREGCGNMGGKGGKVSRVIYCEMISMTYEQKNMSHVVVEGKSLGHVNNGN